MSVVAASVGSYDWTALQEGKTGKQEKLVLAVHLHVKSSRMDCHRRGAVRLLFERLGFGSRGRRREEGARNDSSMHLRKINLLHAEIMNNFIIITLKPLKQKKGFGDT